MKRMTMAGMVIVAALFCGCSFVAPDVSKALSEEEQLKQEKEQTALLQEQNYQLSRIADALEALAPRRQPTVK